MRFSISELLANGACSWRGDGWRPIHHRALGETVFLADQRGVSAILTCVPGVTGLWLLRHRWSGIVKIVSGAKTQRVPLTSDEQDLEFVLTLDVPTDEPVEIHITVDSEPDTPKSHAQVWVLGLTFDRLPLPACKVQTLSSTTRLISGDWGRFLVLSSDAGIPLGILNGGSWAPHDIELFKKHVKRGDCVLDIGAHVGHHSIVFSSLVGHSGFVLSVEAQKLMYQLLNANCAINGAFNVHAVHMAASDHRHVLSLYPTRFAGNNLGSLGVDVDSAVSPHDQGGEVVEAGCVDDLVDRHCARRRVAFIKIDVQAYEKYALLGLLRTIVKDRPKIFFEVAPYWMHRAGYDYRELYEILRLVGYQFEHFTALPLTSAGVPDMPVDERTEWDALAVPESSVAASVVSATRDTLVS